MTGPDGTDLLIPRALLRAPDSFGGTPDGECLLGTPVWHEDRLVGLEPPASHGRATIMLPRLVEAHCHLDKCHTLHRLGDIGGDLRAAIAAQAEDKENWTEADLLRRARHGLAELAQAGAGVVRSHVDWGDRPDPPLAWEVLTGMGADHVQWAALTSVEQMANPAFARAVARRVAQSEGILGAFLLDQPTEMINAALAITFAEADRHGLMLDFHVDEGLGAHNGLEAIADMALETGFAGPILCGHAVSLVDRSPVDFARIADKLAQAEITVCALPTTNLYLQDRGGGTPDRRGITRLSELSASGVRVIVGSDNVADAFCPVGRHDPMAALHLAVLTAHLDPPLGRWLPMVTTDAARALGLDPVFVDGAHRRDLLTYDATTLAALVSGRAAPKGAQT